MDWTQVIFMFIANASLIAWFRAESRSDWRHMDNKLDAFMKGVQEEMKDFHSRLLLLEEKYKSSNK